MKVLVTGAKGQLGIDVMSELKERGHEAIGADIEEMDITKGGEVLRVIEQTAPDAVIHCAAYTAVDRAEDEQELCRKINSGGTKNVAEACARQHCKMMYISTDYVFNGEGVRPWEPMDEKAPLNFYGLTKYEGEQHIESLLKEHFIVRISWVFGKYGNNFVDTMLRLGKERGAVSVVNDQVGSPTYTSDLKRLLVDMIESERYGAYHAANEGICTWYEFAREIFRAANMPVEVTPVTSAEFPSKAKRPKNSRMNKEALKQNGFVPLPPWQDALRRYLDIILSL